MSCGCKKNKKTNTSTNSVNSKSKTTIKVDTSKKPGNKK